MARDKGPKGGGGKEEKPASQQRGKKSGPDLSKKEAASKEELDEALKEYKRDIDETPFSPHEMGRDYPVQEGE
jgi:hypothetical protein